MTLLVAAATAAALWLSGDRIRLLHSPSPDEKDVVSIWIDKSGAANINDRWIAQGRWEEPWRLAVSQISHPAVRIGAADNIAYGLVHQAFSAAWTQHPSSIAYVIDGASDLVPISDPTRSDVLEYPGRHLLDVARDGSLTWDDNPWKISEKNWGGMLQMSAANNPIGTHDDLKAMIEIKIDPAVPYGVVRRLLATIKKNGPRRVGSFEESEIVSRQILPPPPIVPIPPPPHGCGPTYFCR
jgi:biopolymer transport protein ExbD